MDPADSKIPTIPDQTLFVDAWAAYHRGYRTEREDDGRERRIEMLPEKLWRDTDPGFLPVLDERERRMALRAARVERPQEVSNVSLDDALDKLLGEAEDEDDHPASGDAAAQDVGAEERRREADEKQVHAAQERLDEAERRASSALLRKQRATCELQAAERALQTSQADKRSAQRELQQAQALFQMIHRQEETNTRAAQRFARVFGTREDIERQGAEYISPLTSMFTRAYDRYRTAEEVRTQERESAHNSARHTELLTELARSQYPALFYAAQERVERELEEPAPTRTLDDGEDDRPPPKTEEQLTVKLECKVCLQQLADTACLPCGHLVMCVHCADIWIPSRENDHTEPAKTADCPLCRKRVKRRVRVFTS